MLNYKKLFVSAAVCSTLSITAHAGSYEFDNFTLNWDTVFTAGMQFRIQDRKLHTSEGSDGLTYVGTKVIRGVEQPIYDMDSLPTIIDNAFIINSNDGNNNFDKGLTSQRLSILSEADFNFGDWGIFIRGKMWHDFVYGRGSDMTEKAWHSNNSNPVFGSNGGYNSTFGELNPGAQDYAQSGSNLLDAFWYGTITLPNEKEMTLRIGRQVISWGEAMLSGGGLATSINHVDAHIRSQPGLEIKELFLPNGAIFAQVPITDTIGMEAYYQYEWHPIIIDPSGSFTSEFDSIGVGGNTFTFVTGDEKRILGVDLTLQSYTPGSEEYEDAQNLLQFLPTNCPPEADDNHRCRSLVPYKLRTENASDKGQFGVAFNFFLESGDEFGLYFVNYHEKIPSFILPIDSLELFAPLLDVLVNAIDPSNPVDFVGLESLGSTLSTKQLNGLLYFVGALPPGDFTIGEVARRIVDQPELLAGLLSDDIVDLASYVGDNKVANFFIDAFVGAGADMFLAQYGMSSETKVRSLNYRVKYYENVQMLGATYSTVIGDANVAAEVTYRWDTPLLGGNVSRAPVLSNLLNVHLNSLMVFEPISLFGVQLWDFASLVTEFMYWRAPGKLPFDSNDYINPKRLAAQNTPEGFGASAYLGLEYQNVWTGWDIAVPLYMNWGLDGSQFNAGYRDGQVIFATGLTFKHLSGIELGVGVTKLFGDSDDIFMMLNQDRDNASVHFKYSF